MIIVLAVPVTAPVGLPSGPSVTPGEVSVRPAAVSAALFTRAPEKPEPWIHSGLFGAAAFSSSYVKTVGLSSWLRFQPPDVVQIQRPSASSSAFALYMRERRRPLGDQVEPDHLRPAVVALAHAVDMTVDQARAAPAGR